MAGESPDRSKQRESSAKATSGSGDSVPEDHDPRLAVSREKDSSDSQGGGVDTATKILTVRDVAKTDETADETTGAKTGKTGRTGKSDADAAGAKRESADAGDEETPAEDAALREAVSAWVRPTPAKTAAESVASANDADSADGAAEADVAAADAPRDDAEVKADGDDEADVDGTAEPESASEPEAESEPESDSEIAADADAEAAGEADAETEAELADAEADALADTEADADTGQADAEPEGSEAEAEDGDGEDVAEAAADADERESADGGDDPQGPPAADGESLTDGTDGTDGHAKAEGEAEAEAEAEAEDKSGAEAEDAPADAPKAEAEDKGGAEAVDQPTAVFKAVRQPQVDQPTTMLKLGGAPKSPKSPKTDQESPKPDQAGKTDQADPERTSKFVALKPDLRDPKSDVTAAVPQVGPERTTQQPLPPKPPLDLLAELTNTPPPPETPVRTIVRRVKIWTPLVVLLAIVFVVVQALRPLPSPALSLTAKDSYTFDGGAVNLPWPGEGQGWMDGDGIGTMGSFGKQTPVAIGSVAKTMTSYIILRDHPLKPGQEGPRIKIDSTAEKEGGFDKSGDESTLNTVKAGQYLTEKQALSAVMIPSANNIARLLARWDAGSEAAFVKKMNATAKELGMTNTTYTDPSGLTASTVSTAEDQVKLGRAVVKVPALVAITSAASWTDPSGRNWSNVNELPYLIGAIGIKTGSTTAAGGNLLFAARKTVGGQTVTIVGAILGQHKPSIIETVNAVSKTALLAAQNALTSAKILTKGDVVGYVDDQLGGRTPVVVTKDVTAVGWSGLKVKLSFASDPVPHTAKAGTLVGTLTVGDGSAGAVKVPVALQKDLAEPGFGARLTRVG
ncbi:D-alanyl-D-alanine carboxypeptidase [Streptomyces broussonetiae]|uniref:D-alanyl-D-alanine carboxypeptidase n=1 Tax=Streptomyces broussonetiae TaxID=2686304 RepID=UPI004062BBCD